MVTARTGKWIKQLGEDIAYRAFVPNPLPFKIKMDPVLQNLLSKADIALGRLSGMTELLPDVDFFILMYVRKEATLSSQIEGTKATFSDALKAEAKIEDNEIHNDVDEIINDINAMNFGLKRLEALPLSLRLIREMHGILLHGIRGQHLTPGEFRLSQNWIGGASPETASFVPPPAHALHALLDNFEKFIHDKSPMAPLIKTGLLHAQFEAIHPFLDGNGRIGRLLITLYLCERGILRKPVLYLSDFFKRYRQDYYDRLNGAHIKDDIEGWLKFFLEGVYLTAQDAIKTTQKIDSLRTKDMRTIRNSMGKTEENGSKLLQRLFRTPLVRILDVEKITGLSNPNASLLVEKFVKIGILHETTGKKRNRVFSYKDYIQLFDK